jgi:hypothetical protein
MALNFEPAFDFAITLALSLILNPLLLLGGAALQRCDTVQF